MSTFYEPQAQRRFTSAARTPLLRLRLHAEVSVVSGQADRLQDAFKPVRVAEEVYPELPAQDGSFLAALTKRLPPEMPNQRRVAVITGSTSGIGLAIAKRLLHAEYRVTLNYANNDERASKALAECMEISPEVLPINSSKWRRPK